MVRRISDMSDDYIRWIVDEYLRFFATMETVAEKFETTRETISNVLFKAVSENIVDDTAADAVVTKATSFTKNVIGTKLRWERAMELRKNPSHQIKTRKRNMQRINEKIKDHRELIAKYKAKIEELKFQLETYDDFFSGEPEAPSKDVLYWEIRRLERLIANCNQFIDTWEKEDSNLKKAIKEG